jgi:glycosyltransferase involved in cell wall biosynthesis
VLFRSIPFKLVTTLNKGVSSARNIGVSMASGKLISFVDADDILANNFLEVLASNLEVHKATIVFCREIKFKSSEEIKGFNIQKFKKSKNFNQNSLSWLKMFLFRKIKPGIWSFLIDRKIIVSNNLYFREGLDYSEDIEFIFYLLHYSSKTVFIDQFLYFYRVHNNSAMSKFNSKRFQILDAYTELDKFYKLNNKKFYKTFHTFGYSRVLWSITWQFAAATKKFSVFNEFIKPKKLKFMRNLIYPNFFISFSSFLLIISPYLYFLIVKSIILIKKSRKFIYDNK